MAVAVVMRANKVIDTLQGYILIPAAEIDRDVVVKFKELVGEDVAEKVRKAWEEALGGEIRRALTADDLVQEFSGAAWEFWARLLPLLMEVTTRLYASSDIGKVKAYEEELAKAVAKALRASGYARAEDLVYALSALVDRDVWILDWASKLGLNEFVKRLVTRALDEALQLTGYTVYLTFAWLGSTAAVFGLAKEYREANRDQLAAWARQYAEEVQGLLDTLDLLLDDEAYEDLLALGIVKK